MIKYKICRKSKRTGAEGCGEPIFDNWYHAKDVVDSENDKFYEHGVWHWVEAVEVNNGGGFKK